MLGKAFRSSLSPAELDEVISASLMKHPIWSSNGALEDRIYGIPSDEVALSRVYLTKFGDSYTDNALFYMSLVPDGSELTQEMIENNAIFQERQECARAHGGNIFVSEVHAYRPFDGLIDDGSIFSEPLFGTVQEFNQMSLGVAASIIAPVVTGLGALISGAGAQASAITALATAALTCGAVLPALLMERQPIDRVVSSFEIKTTPTQRSRRVAREPAKVEITNLGGTVPMPA